MMNYYLPSPPQSPVLTSTIEEAMCGSCDKVLSSDWFCSDCHSKCDFCNRFLTDSDDYCTRCWYLDNEKHCLIRKQQQQQQQLYTNSRHQQLYLYFIFLQQQNGSYY